jgi:predicted RNA-binding Zn-ribbon protein involved in translation (DUF1610 family)
MDTPPQAPIASTLTCTQCGGELHPDEGQMFVTCPYCASTVYVDKARVVFHWYLAPTLDEAKARGALARWMAGNQTVKDLDKKSRLVAVSFGYFPVWLFKRRTTAGKEEIFIEPAAATSVSELKTLKLPAGDLKKYAPAITPEAVEPSVPLQAAITWLEGRGVRRDEMAEQSLVHIPIFTIKYAYQNQPYTAIVEAGTGGVFANIFPAKAEAPYLLAGGLTGIVFLCLATFPVVGGIALRAEGALIGLAICSVLGLIAAPILFMLAAWVAAKV